MNSQSCAYSRASFGQHFAAHELGGGLAEQPLLVGQVLAREDVVGRRPTVVRNCPPIMRLRVCHRRSYRECRSNVRTLRRSTTRTTERPCLASTAIASEISSISVPIVPTINELFDLTGRVAIVTGGSRGLGQEMAEGLAEAGAR